MRPDESGTVSAQDWCRGDPRDQQRVVVVDLVFAAQVTDLLSAVLGPMPLLSVEVECTTIRCPQRDGSRSVHVPIVEVRAHCIDDVVAAEFARLLGLPSCGTRTFPAIYADVVFVESSWSGWLTRREAAQFAAPVAVSVFGSHDEPTPDSDLVSLEEEANTGAVSPPRPEAVAS